MSPSSASSQTLTLNVLLKHIWFQSKRCTVEKKAKEQNNSDVISWTDHSPSLMNLGAYHGPKKWHEQPSDNLLIKQKIEKFTKTKFNFMLNKYSKRYFLLVSSPLVQREKRIQFTNSITQTSCAKHDKKTFALQRLMLVLFGVKKIHSF